MFVIFRRPKPLFRVGQLVSIPGKEADGGHFMHIRERQWIRQSGYARWDWFYTGTSFKAEGPKLILVCAERHCREQELDTINWFS